MSISAAHASIFYKEVFETGIVWSIRDDKGFPAPVVSGGKRSMPFWSSESRARLIIKNVHAYSDFIPEAIAWTDFCERWVPGLTKDGLLAGINWSGKYATGYDIEPEKLKINVEALRF